MSLPKEPRQKMINMMYLVLTALLALNVSSEILNAFKVVNNSLNNSNVAIEVKNQTLFKSFQAKLEKAETKEKALIWWPKAEKAKNTSEAIFTYLENLKLQLKKESGYNPPKDTSFKEDDLDAATRMFVENKKGKELLQKLTDFKQQILAIDPDFTKEYGSTLPLDLNPPKPKNGSAGEGDWAFGYFHMTPTVAAITILSKFQNDVKNTEAQIVEYCHKKIGEVEVVFDSYAAFAGTNSQYLMPGQELDITAGVGAFSKAAQPRVTVDGTSVPIDPVTGAALYKRNVGNPGPYSSKVRIDFFNQAIGKPDFKEIEVKYTVGSPTGVNVSADAVKVLYVGLENPISISGGSKGAEAIQASIDNGQLKNMGNGKFIATVENPGKATITVNVDGKTSSFDFRVKNVPLPTPMVGNSAGGSVSVNAFKANQGVRAELKDFVFEGVKYTVTSYVIICTGKGFEATGPRVAQVNGNYFSAEAKQYIEMCKAGSSVIFTDIVVEGPSGSRKIDGTMAFNLRP